jgi:hypothetical protein
VLGRRLAALWVAAAALACLRERVDTRSRKILNLLQHLNHFVHVILLGS